MSSIIVVKEIIKHVKSTEILVEEYLLEAKMKRYVRGFFV